MHSIEKSHPCAQLESKDITEQDQKWTDIGSGIIARSFKAASRMITTTRSGPCAEEIHRRNIWNLSTGKVMDDCEVDQVSDAILHRALERPENIRVELTMKKAAGMYLRHGPDVAEIFSQPRICQEASSRGLTPGWSLDLTMKDPATGQRWDLSDKKTQDRVRRLIRDTEPYCIIGSPPCTPFSQLQELSRARRDPKAMKKELDDAKGHIRFCMELYRTQLRARRHFVHEHPETSKAWKMPEVVDHDAN